jgi:hypothetical protein
MFFRGVVMVGIAGLFAFASADLGAEAQARAKGKVAVGKTSQGRGVGVRVNDRAIKMLDFNAELKCRDGSALIVEEGGFLSIDTRRNGSFRDVQYGRTDTVWLRGKVNRNVVRGKLRVTDRWGKIKCNSGWFRFTARIKR